MSSSDVCDTDRVLDRYSNEYRPLCAELVIDTAGFSGAVIVRVHCPAGEFCLRGWPPAQLARRRILGLHRLLAEIARHGVNQLPVPVPSLDRNTLVAVNKRLWQLEPWMPGEADFWKNPSDSRLRAAMVCLASWHQAAAQFEPREEESAWFDSASGQPSPAVTERLEHIRRWNHSRLEQVRRYLQRSEPCEFRETAQRILRLFERVSPSVTHQLQTAHQLRYRLQPCLRDVWHDHLLFTGDEVTGLIDASACRTENVVTDLARLLGSLVEDDRRQWDVALDEYQKQRPLTLDELALLQVLDRSGVLLSGMTWLDRKYLQRAEFQQPERVLDRLRAILVRLTALAETV